MLPANLSADGDADSAGFGWHVEGRGAGPGFIVIGLLCVKP